ncbi:RING-finger domain containing protein [Hordeum vulgare]|nr:RING-finger domain containing protein [Hordeum vulgare]
MSSMMERLRFLGLYCFRSDDFPPEYNYSHPAASDTVGTKQQYNRSRSKPAARKPASKTGNEAEKAARAKVATKEAVTAEVRRLERAPVPAATKGGGEYQGRIFQDLWVLTGDDDVIDPVTLEKENVRHFHSFIDSLPLIVPDNLLLVYYDYLHLIEICIFNFNIDV